MYQIGSKIIRLSDVSLTLNKKLILKNLNLEIKSNDKIGLIGSNGSGKTVLLRLLAGIYKSYSGNITQINDFFFLSTPGAGSHPSLKLVDNIKRILSFHGIDTLEKSKLNQLIYNFELSDYVNYQFKDLSQGYKLRISMVIFFLLNFKNVLIDEFFGFGDKFIINKFQAELNQKYENSDCLVVASHNINLINKFCNRIIEIEKGSIINDYRI